MERFIILAFFVSYCSAQGLKAHVKLVGAEDPSQIGGHLGLIQRGDRLMIMGVVHDLEPGSVHGFHIHQNGSTGNKCMDAGGHYNPLSTTHGGPTDETRHVGDLGNIRADRNGEAKIRIIDSMALLHGPYSILNRSIVIHQKADDLGKADTEDSTKTGSAGPRIFCGIIRKV